MTGQHPKVDVALENTYVKAGQVLSILLGIPGLLGVAIYATYVGTTYLGTIDLRLNDLEEADQTFLVELQARMPRLKMAERNARSIEQVRNFLDKNLEGNHTGRGFHKIPHLERLCKANPSLNCDTVWTDEERLKYREWVRSQVHQQRPGGTRFDDDH